MIARARTLVDLIVASRGIKVPCPPLLLMLVRLLVLHLAFYVSAALLLRRFVLCVPVSMSMSMSVPLLLRLFLLLLLLQEGSAFAAILALAFAFALTPALTPALALALAVVVGRSLALLTLLLLLLRLLPLALVLRHTQRQVELRLYTRLQAAVLLQHQLAHAHEVVAAQPVPVPHFDPQDVLVLAVGQFGVGTHDQGRRGVVPLRVEGLLDDARLVVDGTPIRVGDARLVGLDKTVGVR